MDSNRCHSARRWRRLLGGLTVGTIVLATGGCSTGSGQTVEQVDVPASAQGCVAAVDEYFNARGGLLPSSLPDTLTPLGKAPAKGLSFTKLSRGNPTDSEFSKMVFEATDAIGWRGRTLAFDGSVEDLNRKALEAIDDSDIVMIDGFPSAAVQAPIKAARDKGVLLMLGSITEQPVSVPGFGATMQGGDYFNKMGELSAYAFLRATKCQGNLATFGIPYDYARTMGQTMEEVVTRECEECSYSYTEIPLNAIGSPAATNAVVSKLQSDPTVDFAFFTFGDLATGVPTSLKQAGIDAQVGGAIPTAANLVATAKGDNSFWVGTSLAMTGWLAIDLAARALDSGGPAVGNNSPVAVFTTDNIESADPVPVYPGDYQDKFKALWGV